MDGWTTVPVQLKEFISSCECNRVGRHMMWASFFTTRGVEPCKNISSVAPRAGVSTQVFRVFSRRARLKFGTCQFVFFVSVSTKKRLTTEFGSVISFSLVSQACRSVAGRPPAWIHDHFTAQIAVFPCCANNVNRVVPQSSALLDPSQEFENVQTSKCNFPSRDNVCFGCCFNR